MIRDILSSYPIQIQTVNNNYPSYSPTIHRPVFWNTTTNQLEIMGDDRFEPAPSVSLTVTISQPAQEAIEWAQRKMQEEQEIEQLCQTTPALADLRDKFRATLCLVRNNNGQQ